MKTIFAIIALIFSVNVWAQTYSMSTTTMVGNASESGVTFNATNNNSTPIGVSQFNINITSNSGLMKKAKVWYKKSPITVAPTAINAANGWFLMDSFFIMDSIYLAGFGSTNNIIIPSNATYGIYISYEGTFDVNVQPGFASDSSNGLTLTLGNPAGFGGSPIPNVVNTQFVGFVVFNMLCNNATAPNNIYNFEGVTIPAGFAGASLLANHGTLSSKGLSKNIYSNTLNYTLTTPRFTTVNGAIKLDFDYRLVDWMGYANPGGTAKTFATNDSINIFMTLDCGATYQLVSSITSANYVANNLYKKFSQTFTAPNGTFPSFKIVHNWKVGDYYFDIDNFGINGANNNCNGITKYVISGTDTVCNGSAVTIAVSPSTAGVTGLTFAWSNGSTGNFIIDSALNNVCKNVYMIATCNATNPPVKDTSFHTICGKLCTPVLCSSAATQTGDGDILNVTLGSLNNTSTCATTGGAGSILNRYSNYTNTGLSPVNVARGQTVPLKITIGTCGVSNFTTSYRVFIDYNNDLDFLDAGEIVYTSTTQSILPPTTSSANILIPANATLGNVRMRVVMIETSSPTSITSCGTYSYGETEDYMINIGPAIYNCNIPPANNKIIGDSMVCFGDTASLLLIQDTMLNGLKYQWQVSTDSITWSNLPNDTLWVIDHIINTCKYFRVKTTCTYSGNTSYSLVRKVCPDVCRTTMICDSLKKFTYTITNNVGKFYAPIAPSIYTVSWMWKFSNGATSTLPNPTIGFSNGGHWAKLIYCVSDTFGLICCDSLMKFFNINNVITCTGLKANFGYATNGSNVMFTDSSTAPVGMALTYAWSFGNGMTSTQKNPTIQYQNNGVYTMQLIITSWLNNGIFACRDTVYKIVTITNASVCNKLIPFYSYTKSNMTVTFANSTTYNGLGAVGTSWNFGDGTTSTLPNPVKTYTSNGTKTVTLTITALDTPTGTVCTKVYTQSIYVAQITCASQNAYFTTVKNFLNIQFNNTSYNVGSAPTYLWNFGTGATSTAVSPNYTYPLPGNYKVTLTVTSTINGAPCTSSSNIYVNVTSTNPCKDSGYVNQNPYTCPTYLQPVCGCDSITYPNYCTMQKNGVKNYTNGPCAWDTNYVTVCGYVYNDSIRNCAKDPSEAGMKNISMKISNVSGFNKIIYTDANGYYKFIVPKGTYTVTQNISGSYTYASIGLKQSCPTNNAPITVNAMTAGATFCNNDFYDTVRNCKDLSVTIQNSFTSAPGFPRKYYVKYVNKSPFAVANVVVKLKKNAVQSFTSSTPSPSSVSGQIYTWNIGTLNAYQSGQIVVNLLTPIGTPLGGIVRDSAWIMPDSADCEIDNNATSFADTVKGSWDPNDKAVNPKGAGTKGEIVQSTKTLDYLVRFQNTGNAPAFNVRVEDVLSANLDWASLRIEGTSHPYSVYMDDNGKAILEFKNIMLPDSGTDYEASQGYIHYSIDLKNNLPLGTEVLNTAAIYFDFNEPVITNTTINTLVQKTSSISAVTAQTLSYKVFPNPVMSNASILINSELSQSVEMMIQTVDGKVILSENHLLKSGSQIIDINTDHLSKGLYILKIKESNGSMSSVKIVKE
jgi:uncharacterized repeat protein (TIGR01451 family)